MRLSLYLYTMEVVLPAVQHKVLSNNRGSFIRCEYHILSKNTFSEVTVVFHQRFELTGFTVLYPTEINWEVLFLCRAQSTIMGW